MKIECEPTHIHIDDNHVTADMVDIKVNYIIDMTFPFFIHGMNGGEFTMLEFNATNKTHVKIVCKTSTLSLIAPYYGKPKDETAKTERNEQG
jgi:hypothetical protein